MGDDSGWAFLSSGHQGSSIFLLLFWLQDGDTRLDFDSAQAWGTPGRAWAAPAPLQIRPSSWTSPKGGTLS